MKAFILSAGKGERMYPLTKDTPKSLLKLGNGSTVLDTQLHTIQRSNINEVVIVVGYKHEKIGDKVRCYRDKGMNITTIFNPFYDLSNAFVSLWLCQNEMTEDFIIMNGDTLFKPEVLKKLIEAGEGIYVAIDKKEKYGLEDMKVKIKDNRIVYVSKNIDSFNADGRAVGIIKVQGGKYIRIFNNCLNEIPRKNIEYRNRFWLETFSYLSNEGHQVKYITISPKDWKEIDFHIDLEYIKREVLFYPDSYAT